MTKDKLFEKINSLFAKVSELFKPNKTYAIIFLSLFFTICFLTYNIDNNNFCKYIELEEAKIVKSVTKQPVKKPVKQDSEPLKDVPLALQLDFEGNKCFWLASYEVDKWTPIDPDLTSKTIDNYLGQIKSNPHISLNHKISLLSFSDGLRMKRLTKEKAEDSNITLSFLRNNEIAKVIKNKRKDFKGTFGTYNISQNEEIGNNQKFRSSWMCFKEQTHVK